LTKSARFFDRATARAAVLSRLVPALQIKAERLAGLARGGEHAIARGGAGREFWQYREAQPGEARERIDWRRSGRDDALYVRETEGEEAHELVIWCDARPNMHLPDEKRSKLARALVIAGASAMTARAAHERVSLLGAPRSHRPDEVAALHASGVRWPDGAFLPRSPCHLLIVSDFFEPTDMWTGRLNRLDLARTTLTLCTVRDETEVEFTFRGRVRFFDALDGRTQEAGRAEMWKRRFEAVLGAHDRALTELAVQAGGQAGGQRLDHLIAQDEKAFFLALTNRLRVHR
jgi:uncharacterized protein (DUF58 family)